MLRPRLCLHSALECVYVCINIIYIYICCYSHMLKANITGGQGRREEVFLVAIKAKCV